MAWFLPSCSCCNVERSNGGERSEPELTTASGYAPEHSEYWFKHLYQASACFSAFILFEKIPGHVFRRFAYSPQPGAGFLPGGMETSALECRVPSRSGAAAGALHPCRSGRSGWRACPKAGDAESDVVVLVGRIVVVAVRGLQVVVVVVARAPRSPSLQQPFSVITPAHQRTSSTGASGFRDILEFFKKIRPPTAERVRGPRGPRRKEKREVTLSRHDKG